MRRALRTLFSGLIVVLLSASTVMAQATAQITGTVKDSSGGVLPGASVTVTQTETGFKREAISDTDGVFNLPSLPIGPYRLEVALQGFRTFVQTGIVLQVNSNPSVPVVLELGTVQEAITVTANTQTVETRALGISQVMENKRILELPLNGRNPADLLALLPAAVPQPQLNSTSRSMGGSSGGQAYSLAGGLSFGVSWILDGAMHNNPYDNLNMPLPFPDALQEFRAETSAMTAQNGMHSGGAVNAVTKSGTNSFRGDAFEFFRHHNMNATDPFATKNADGSRKGDGLKRNQYGVTIGGPIKTDSLFFFYGYQGTNTTVNPTDNRAFVPTSAMLQGDFTAFASPACNAGVQRNLGTPFVGNRVIPALFSRAALNITSRLPTTTDPCGLVQYGLPSETDEWQQVAKVDFTMSEKHSLFGRYIATSQFTPPPFSLEAAQENLLVTRIGGRDNLAQTFTLGENYVINSTHAERGSLGLQPHRHSPDEHRLLLRARSGHQHLQLHAELHAADGHRRLPASSSAAARRACRPSRPRPGRSATTSRWFAAATSSRSAEPGRAGRRSRWPTCARPASSAIDGSITGLPLADFMLGRIGTNGLIQAAQTRSTWKQVCSACTRRTRGVSARADLQLRPALGAVLPAATRRTARSTSSIRGGSSRAQRAPCSRTVRPGCTSRAIPGSRHKAGMKTDWSNFGPRVGLAWDPTGDGRTSMRASLRPLVRVRERAVPSQHVGRAAVGLGSAPQQPAGRPRQSVHRQLRRQTNIFPVTFDQNAPFSLNGPFLSPDQRSRRDATSTRSTSRSNVSSRGDGPHPPATSAAARTTSGSRRRSTTRCSFRCPVPAPLPTPPTPTPGVRSRCTTRTTAGTTAAGSICERRQTELRRHAALGPRPDDAATISANYTLSHCYGSPDGNGGGTTNVSSATTSPRIRVMTMAIAPPTGCTIS